MITTRGMTGCMAQCLWGSWDGLNAGLLWMGLALELLAVAFLDYVEYLPRW